MLVAIINPASGHRQASFFFDHHLRPLLPAINHVFTTTAQGDAENFIHHLPDAPLTIVLLSGDGTLHEIINALPHRNISFVLVPCGTANALYASLFPPAGLDKIEYKLQSVRAFLANAAPVHISLASASIAATSSLASVVVSTALHANILHHSESLRRSHPGIERFKIAAEQNSTKWYRARARILPVPGDRVQIYDPKSSAFIPHPDASPDLELDGPFAYFLSTVNVDRLEPHFRISPLARIIAPPPSTCDIIVLRPLRDPQINDDSDDARKTYVEKVWQVLGAAYQNGTHVNFTYETTTGEIQVNGDGPVVIEYFRAGGWEWFPDPQDEDAHLVCADGAVHRISPGERAACIIDQTPHTFSVYGPV
ncbi:Sphingosine kinase 1 [Psilocybe cubensis]|uniref:DAGKc domain-containing protein n=2 Tax=Psilocybe cubensis TaxID=181762 RepID=A0A8H7Y1S3_PSICU|nr:Sphingosine kinase 1 [Psilocybe cubensis]KAH9483814.1 Sphingosine kinase 1 [Psilocybe cubensis]